MLTIKCSACKTKLWKYDKYGKGEILRCYKDRIIRWLLYQQKGSKVCCTCGQEIGIDKGAYIKMIKKGFIYSGTKRH